MQKTIYSRQSKLVTTLLREFRQAREMTQVELAKKLGISQSDLSKVERGARRIDFVELRHWAAAVGIDMGLFVAEFEARLEAASVAARVSGRSP
ncbi:helix-turn-helix domain-containing protein [Variovorax paradoxus]|uniref:helix-turn-helix domain-containing protein n=1 Tax=Variovorax paradoxus TaxID=34073 RepID=UPI003ECF788F